MVIEYPVESKHIKFDSEYKNTKSIPSAFAFGRLLSPVYDLQKSDQICISFRYKIRPASYGNFYLL